MTIDLSELDAAGIVPGTFSRRLDLRAAPAESEPSRSRVVVRGEDRAIAPKPSATQKLALAWNDKHGEPRPFVIANGTVKECNAAVARAVEFYRDKRPLHLKLPEHDANPILVALLCYFPPMDFTPGNSGRKMLGQQRDRSGGLSREEVEDIKRKVVAARAAGASRRKAVTKR